jgi:hypothetical protein
MPVLGLGGWIERRNLKRGLNEGEDEREGTRLWGREDLLRGVEEAPQDELDLADVVLHPERPRALVVEAEIDQEPLRTRSGGSALRNGEGGKGG